MYHSLTDIEDRVRLKNQADIADLDKQIAAKQAELNVQRSKIKDTLAALQPDLFGETKTMDEGLLFPAEEMPIDYSPENLQRIVKPIEDEIVRLNRIRTSLIESEDRQVEIALLKEQIQPKLL